MAYKQNNPLITNIDPPADTTTASNIEKRKEAQEAYEAEKRRVAQVKQNIVDIAERAQGTDEFTRDNIRGGKLVPERTYNWLETSGGAGCSTYACSIMREAGATVPDSVGPEGITINNINYKPGDPMPIIPGNEQFDAVAPKLGFELKPPGSWPEGGEVTRVGYGLGRTGHSTIQTGKGTSIYNPGTPSLGLKESTHFTGTTLTQPLVGAEVERMQSESEFYGIAPPVLTDGKIYEDRLMEYRGNLPALHKKLREADKPFLKPVSVLKPREGYKAKPKAMNLSKQMTNFFNRKK